MNQFLDDLAEYLALHVKTNYPIFVGDFNIHWGDEVDGNATLFAGTLEALGLIQHIQFPTHSSSNIVDLVISKVLTNKFILQCFTRSIHLRSSVGTILNSNDQGTTKS